MKRKCFFCDIDTETIFSNEWDLAGLDSCEIGFSICTKCGLVIQSPSVGIDNMNKYYATTATYINPGRKGKPSSNKTKDVKRFIKTLIDITEEPPRSAFQVGCSDGYTLYAFQQAGIFLTEGIDTGLESHKLATDLYNIKTIVGTFEDFVPSNKYDLIILTHVLEHLYNPIQIMNKCSSMQKDGDWVLIEVPLLERADRFPPGLLTLEHLNYFSESTLLHLLSLTGYTPYKIDKLFYNNEYPVITVVARKEIPKEIEVTSDFERANSLLVSYHKKDNAKWKEVEFKIKNQIKKRTSVYIWGAGIHTSQLLANTDLKKHLKILGLLDSSPTKWEKKFGSMTCYSPDSVNLKEGDTIIISSYASEQEIYANLSKVRQDGVIVKKLYGETR